MATKISPPTRIFSPCRSREETPDGIGRELPLAEFRGDHGDFEQRPVGVSATAKLSSASASRMTSHALIRATARRTGSRAQSPSSTMGPPGTGAPPARSMLMANFSAERIRCSGVKATRAMPSAPTGTTPALTGCGYFGSMIQSW